MNILLKSAKVIDPESAFHLQTKDILINEGVITEIAEHIAPREEKVIENTYVSQGWTDSSVCFGAKPSLTACTPLSAVALPT